MSPDFDITQTIGFSLHHASYVLRSTLKAAFRQAGLEITTEEFVLLALIPKAGMTQQALLELAMKDKTQLTRLLDRLVAKGWVRRRQRKENRREQEVFLTAKGGKTQQRLVKLAQQVVPQGLKGVSPKDVETTRRTLNAMMRNWGE